MTIAIDLDAVRSAYEDSDIEARIPCEIDGRPATMCLSGEDLSPEFEADWMTDELLHDAVQELARMMSYGSGTP